MRSILQVRKGGSFWGYDVNMAYCNDPLLESYWTKLARQQERRGEEKRESCYIDISRKEGEQEVCGSGLTKYTCTNVQNVYGVHNIYCQGEKEKIDI